MSNNNDHVSISNIIFYQPFLIILYFTNKLTFARNSRYIKTLSTQLQISDTQFRFIDLFHYTQCYNIFVHKQYSKSGDGNLRHTDHIWSSKDIYMASGENL